MFLAVRPGRKARTGRGLIPLGLDLEGVRRGETRTEDERGLERRG